MGKINAECSRLQARHTVSNMFKEVELTLFLTTFLCTLASRGRGEITLPLSRLTFGLQAI